MEVTLEGEEGIPNDVDGGSQLNVLFCLDTAWTMAWEGGVYMLNLWIVFLSDSIEEMILNCLAAEFITAIDDEVIRFYLKRYGISGQAYKDANQKQASKIGTWFMVIAFFFGLLAGG